MNIIRTHKDRKQIASAGTDTDGLSRRKLFVGGSVLASALVAHGLHAKEAQAHGWLQVEVPPDLDTYDSMREPLEGDAFPLGPFYIQGPIYPQGTLNEDGTPPDGAQSIGTFRCWGWQYDGSAMTGNGAVQQIYELDDLGEIHVQGKDMNSKPIIGGRGAFRDATGEMIREDINPENFSFRATFTD